MKIKAPRVMKGRNPHLPPTHPVNAAPSEHAGSARRQPEAAAREDYILLSLPRSKRWAHSLADVARFLAVMDMLALEQRRIGDELYKSDVRSLAQSSFRKADAGALLVATVLIAAMKTETAISVLHSALCDAETHGPNGECEWREKLASGFFALL